MADVVGYEREIQGLMESLLAEFRLEDPLFTTTVRAQETSVNEIYALAAGTAMGLSRSYMEAVNGDDGEEWRMACDKEIKMLMYMRVWKEVKVSSHQKVFLTKWVFAYKFNSNGEIIKGKARYVVRGFSQREGVDLNKTFAPTAKFTSLMVLFSVAVRKGWKIRGFDVVAACPHSPIDENIYIRPPEGYPK